MGAETELILPTTKSCLEKDNAKLSDDKFGINNSEFPAGLRVLVVDDDPICLLILDRMLQRCRYRVTTCGGAVEALRVLRENKDGFDVVISDVHMPDMDGFKLLELIGLEMDLPVIMMSANGETCTVMKGIKHGACDYLLKPVRMEELKNIWQHVVRKKKKDGGDGAEEKRLNESGDNQSNDGPDISSKQQKKRKEDEDDPEVDNDDPSTSKKPRVVWSVELHQKFVNAVNQLGIDKAVPKRILELMDVRGLTRENVASHLQKYRLYLKRISGVAHQSGCTMLSSSDNGFGITRPSFSDFVSSLQTGSLDRAGHNNWPGVAGSDLYKFRQLAALHGNAGGPIARSPYGLSLNSISSGLQPSLATGLNVNPVSGIRQSGLFNLSPNAPRAGLLDLHQLSPSTNISGIGPLVGGPDNNRLAIDNHNNSGSNNNADSLILKLLQQRNSARMTYSAGENQITNTDISDAERIRKAIGLNSGLGVNDIFNQRNTSSNEYNAASREMDADIKNLCSPYNISSKISPSIGLQATNSISVKQSVPTVNETLDMVGSRNINPISTKSSIIENAGLLDWQSLVQNQNSGHKLGFGLSSQVNQNYGHLQGFRDNVDKKPVVSSMNNQSMQDGLLLDSICDMPKVCDGMTHDSFHLLDDTLASYTKPVQTQGLNQTENNFGIEGYVLGNMHVK